MMASFEPPTSKMLMHIAAIKSPRTKEYPAWFVLLL
jgi:hypothetical protein